MNDIIFHAAKTGPEERIYCSECEEVLWECPDVRLGIPQFSSLWFWCNSMTELIKEITKSHIHEKNKILPLGLE